MRLIGFLAVLALVLAGAAYATRPGLADFDAMLKSQIEAKLASTDVGASDDALGTVALKWALLGRVRPGTHGLWSAWCCRWDFLYMAWGRLAHGPLSSLAGTLWIPCYLRAMGMRIGHRVVLAGSFAQVVDPDMLTIEDEATVDPLFQAHTFEDRVLKIGPVRIRAGATIRRGTVLFYGADVGEGCHVAPHGVVMKHERLESWTRYAGCPTRRTD